MIANQSITNRTFPKIISNKSMQRCAWQRLLWVMPIMVIHVPGVSQTYDALHSSNLSVEHSLMQDLHDPCDWSWHGGCPLLLPEEYTHLHQCKNCGVSPNNSQQQFFLLLTNFKALPFAAFPIFEPTCRMHTQLVYGAATDRNCNCLAFFIRIPTDARNIWRVQVSIVPK